MNANQLLSRPKPPNWSDQDELAYRIAVEELGRYERNPYAMNSAADFQREQLENREVDAKYGYGASNRLYREDDNAVIDSIMGQFFRKKK